MVRCLRSIPAQRTDTLAVCLRKSRCTSSFYRSHSFHSDFCACLCTGKTRVLQSAAATATAAAAVVTAAVGWPPLLLRNLHNRCPRSRTNAETQTLHHHIHRRTHSYSHLSRASQAGKEEPKAVGPGYLEKCMRCYLEP